MVSPQGRLPVQSLPHDNWIDLHTILCCCMNVKETIEHCLLKYPYLFIVGGFKWWAWSLSPSIGSPSGPNVPLCCGRTDVRDMVFKDSSGLPFVSFWFPFGDLLVSVCLLETWFSRIVRVFFLYCFGFPFVGLLVSICLLRTFSGAFSFLQKLPLLVSCWSSVG